MAFPTNPILNQIYFDINGTFLWNGSEWIVIGNPSFRNVFASGNTATANIANDTLFITSNTLQINVNSISKTINFEVGNVAVEVTNLENYITGVNATQNAEISYALTTANNAQNSIVVIQGVDTTQNVLIASATTLAQAAYNAANAAGSSTLVQFAANTANSASANTIYTQGVDLTQNTNISYAIGLAQAAYNQANTDYLNNLVFYAADKANSASANTIYTQGVDATQNTNITNLSTSLTNQITYQQNVDNVQNNNITTTQSWITSNVARISGIDSTQNTNIIYATGLAQAAYNQANSGSSGTISGILSVTDNYTSIASNYDANQFITLNNQTNITDLSFSPTDNRVLTVGASNNGIFGTTTPHMFIRTGGGDLEFQTGNIYVGSTAYFGTNLYLSGTLYDFQNNSYYLKPSGTSVLNTVYVQGNIYDNQNAAYYVKPSGTSKLSFIELDPGNSIVTGGNFGIYAGSGYYIRTGSPSSYQSAIFIPQTTQNVNIGTETDNGYKLYVNGSFGITGNTGTNTTAVLGTNLNATADPNFRLFAGIGPGAGASTEFFRFGIDYGQTIPNAGIGFYRGGGATGGYLTFNVNNWTTAATLDASSNFYLNGIYYDGSNSAYYIKPSGTSNLWNLNIGSGINSSGNYFQDTSGGNQLIQVSTINSSSVREGLGLWAGGYPAIYSGPDSLRIITGATITPGNALPTGGNTALTITPTGFIGIGTVSPSFLIDGFLSSGDASQRLKSGNGGAEIELDATNGYASLRIANNGTELWRVGQVGQSVNFEIYQIGAGDRLVIDRTGNIYGYQSYYLGGTLYDNSNTAYYVKPSGTTNLNYYISSNSTQNGAINFGSGFTLYLNSSGASSTSSTGASMSESWGPVWNLHSGGWAFQVENGPLLVGYSSNGSNYGTVPAIYLSGNQYIDGTYYDYQNTGYYIKPSSLSVINTLNSISGGSGSQSAINISNGNGYGGTGYAGIMSWTNTGASNPNKFWRMNPTGGIELINNAYTATILSIQDNGDFNVTGSITTNAGSSLQFGGGAVAGFYSDGTNEAIRNANTAGSLFLQGPNGGTTYMYMNSSSIIIPLSIYNSGTFYDNQNTSYYLKPSGTTILNSLTATTLNIPITSGYINVGSHGWLHDDGNFHIHSTTGALWLNAADNTNSVNINAQANGNVLLTNGVGYVSVNSGLNLTQGWRNTAGATTSEISNDLSSYKALMLVGNSSGGGTRQVQVYDDLNITSGNFKLSGTYYDLTNTGYYVKPSGTTNINNVKVNGNLVFGDGTEINSFNSLGFRNRIINGDMRISQRGSGPFTSGYTLDRWSMIYNVNSKYNVQQYGIGLSYYPTGMLITSLSAYTVAAGDVTGIMQTIEGTNIADLGWGTSAAKTMTLSFWAKCSLTGQFGGSITNSSASVAPTRTLPFSYNISTASVWQKFVINIPGDTTGSWASNTYPGISVMFSTGTGTSGQGTPGVWSSTAYYDAIGSVSLIGTNGATLEITGVQFEEGTVATPFELRSYGQELALCQRYFCLSPISVTAAGSGGFTNVYSPRTSFPVHMRGTPTITVYDAVGNNGAVTYYTGGSQINGASSIITSSSADSFCVQGATSPAITTGSLMAFSYIASAEF